MYQCLGKVKEYVHLYYGSAHYNTAVVSSSLLSVKRRTKLNRKAFWAFRFHQEGGKLSVSRFIRPPFHMFIFFYWIFGRFFYWVFLSSFNIWMLNIENIEIFTLFHFVTIAVIPIFKTVHIDLMVTLNAIHDWLQYRQDFDTWITIFDSIGKWRAGYAVHRRRFYTLSRDERSSRQLIDLKRYFELLYP